MNNYQLSRRGFIVATGLFALSLSPVQAFAYDTETETKTTGIGISEINALLEYYNKEFGSNVSYMPNEIQNRQGYYFPDNSIDEYADWLRGQIESSTYITLSSKIACVNAYMNSSYNEGVLPSFDNKTPWAINTMISIIIQKKYGERVIKYIAEQNDEFAKAINHIDLINLTTSNDCLVPQDDGKEDVNAVRSTKDVDYSKPLGPGVVTKARIESKITNDFGYWQWTSLPNAKMSLGIVAGYARLDPTLATYTKSIADSNRTWCVTWSGWMQWRDYVGGFYSAYESRYVELFAAYAA